LSVRIELDDHAGHLIDHPDVVLRIDPHLLRNQESVRILSDLANEFPVLIELEEARASVRERPRGADGNGRMAGAGVNENIALELVATPAASPIWMLVGNFNGSAFVSKEISGMDWATMDVPERSAAAKSKVCLMASPIWLLKLSRLAASR